MAGFITHMIRSMPSAEMSTDSRATATLPDETSTAYLLFASTHRMSACRQKRGAKATR